MHTILIIAKETAETSRLSSDLVKEGSHLSLVSDCDQALELIWNQAPDLILLEMPASSSASETRRFMRKVKQEQSVPLLVLMPEEELGHYDFTLGIEDFVLKPCSSTEIISRIRQILWRTSKLESKEVIKCGDLVIDLAKYEVFLRGRLITLTFKEFELLKFLVSHRGKVFTREALLNKVWGYDYYGGDRTVDVHIRRLRSKIEDKTHSFIDTVRNVGYRFKE